MLGDFSLKQHQVLAASVYQMDLVEALFPDNSTAAPSPALSDDSSSELDDNMSDVGADPTTLIVRNLSREISRASVLQCLDENGFGGCYDFIYCPLDYCTRKGFGYVMLNFMSSADAFRFQNKFHQFDGSWPEGTPARNGVLEVVWSRGVDRQGLQANIDRYRNSPVMHSIVPDDFKPVLLSCGRRVHFPRPTEKLEAPTRLPRSVWKAWTAEKKGRAPICSSRVDNLCLSEKEQPKVAPITGVGAKQEVSLKIDVSSCPGTTSHLDVHILAVQSQMHLLQRRLMLLQECRHDQFECPSSATLGFSPPPGLAPANNICAISL